MMDMSFFDWSDLGTFAGALAAVVLLTELTKSLPGIRRIPTQLFSWLLACGILILAAWFNMISVIGQIRGEDYKRIAGAGLLVGDMLEVAQRLVHV